MQVSLIVYESSRQERVSDARGKQQKKFSSQSSQFSLILQLRYLEVVFWNI
jgi:hypothetical protein